jgi:EamA domain-containing membrane protein RarD
MIAISINIKKTMKKLILKNKLIKKAPTIVIITSTIAKLKNLIECAPSPSFPKMFLYSLNGQLIYLNVRIYIYINKEMVLEIIGILLFTGGTLLGVSMIDVYVEKND